MNDWLIAALAAGGGLILGTIAGRVTQNLCRRSKVNVVQTAAVPLGSLVFSALLVAGLITALGFVNDEALDQLPRDLVDYLPRVLSAGIVLILGNVAAELSAAAVGQTASRMGAAGRNLPTLLRAVILGFTVILASAQLGIDTTIINIAVAALLFSIGLGAALMIGLGSRHVSGEVAAGRAVRRMLNAGDQVTVGQVTGTVANVGTVAVELLADDGTLVMVPNSKLVTDTITVRRATP